MAEPIKRRIIMDVNGGGESPRRITQETAESPDWMVKGPAALQTLAQEKERQEAETRQRQHRPRLPYRLWLPPGSFTDIIILDASINDARFVYEHQLRNPQTGRYDIYELYPRDRESGCPLCAQKKSTYVMFLTCVDLRPFRRRDGTQVPYSRKLLAVSSISVMEAIQAIDRRSKGLRGVRLRMTRPENGQDISPATGFPIFVDKYDEESLVISFASPEVVADDGVVIEAENTVRAPLEYSRFFRRPSVMDLRQRYGGGGSDLVGSREHVRRVWDSPGPAGSTIIRGCVNSMIEPLENEDNTPWGDDTPSPSVVDDPDDVAL